MLIFRKIHTVNYKSKTNTKTVWQYKSFRAVYQLPVGGHGNHVCLCDLGTPTYLVRPSVVRRWFSCGHGSHVRKCDIGSPTYLVQPSAAHRWQSYHNTYMKSLSYTICVGLAQARPNHLHCFQQCLKVDRSHQITLIAKQLQKPSVTSSVFWKHFLIVSEGTCFQALANHLGLWVI